MDVREYDVVVIGAGPVGENVADRTVQGGLRTVIVESELVGGECSYWACMPSKALLRAVEALQEARSVAGAAQAVNGDLDVEALFRRRDEFTHDWHDDGQVSWLEGAGIDLIRGRARLAGPKRVEVVAADDEVVRLVANVAVAICTGTSARVPDILASIGPWTSREATSAASVPESLAVVGGGVVGIEMATLFTALGSDVTVIAPSGVLPKMEPFVGDAVTESLRSAGATVLGARAVSARRDGDHKTVVLDNGTEVTASEVLVAVGREPRTTDLGLATLELDDLQDGQSIEVDDTMLVPGTDWLYAVGDVNGRVLLTHQGKYQARAAGDVIVARAADEQVDDVPWGVHVATADHAAVPQVVFSDPPAASVGRTAEQAERDGVDIRVLDYDLSSVAGAALHADGYRGAARAVVDQDHGVLVGATFVGSGVAELLHAATVAVVGEVPLDRLWHAVPAYPTISEVWLRWLEEYGRPTA